MAQLAIVGGTGAGALQLEPIGYGYSKVLYKKVSNKHSRITKCISLIKDHIEWFSKQFLPLSNVWRLMWR